MQTTTNQQISGRELVAQFWQQKMNEHPTFYARLNIAKGILDFFFGGHVIPWALYKALMFSSRVADGVLMAAALWITAINVAPQFMTGLVGGGANASNLSSLSLLSFSLLPELITVAALVLTIKHIITFCKRREWKNPAWGWALLYAIPTLTFLSMTIWTISSFVSHDGGSANITGGLLVTRCLAAWGYSFVEILFFELGRQSMVEADEKAKLRNEIEELRTSLVECADELDAEKLGAFEQMRTLSSESQRKEADLRTQISALTAELEQEKTHTSTQTTQEITQESTRTSARMSAPPNEKTTQETTRRKPAEKNVRSAAGADEVSARRAAREERNAKILALYATKSNRQIADQLEVSEKTVRDVLAANGIKRSQESGEIIAVN